jgi:hypothetical protein
LYSPKPGRKGIWNFFGIPSLSGNGKENSTLFVTRKLKALKAVFKNNPVSDGKVFKTPGFQF